MTEGYYIKLLTNTVLTLGCTQVDPVLTPIPLTPGWNIVSYLRDDPMDASAALASLGPNLIIAKNNTGNVFFPAVPLNTIGDCLPGQGYQVKVASADTLWYPANTVRMAANVPYVEAENG